MEQLFEEPNREPDNVEMPEEKKGQEKEIALLQGSISHSGVRMLKHKRERKMAQKRVKMLEHMKKVKQQQKKCKLN